MQMRALNVYVNQPDDYFFQGGSRTGMGYDESQYSLPRWRDLSISRMGLYDDLYVHTPTQARAPHSAALRSIAGTSPRRRCRLKARPGAGQGWMFVPLGDYHSGGTAATFDGFERELEWAFAQVSVLLIHPPWGCARTSAHV